MAAIFLQGISFAVSFNCSCPCVLLFQAFLGYVLTFVFRPRNQTSFGARSSYVSKEISCITVYNLKPDKRYISCLVDTEEVRGINSLFPSILGMVWPLSSPDWPDPSPFFFAVKPTILIILHIIHSIP